MLLVGGIAICYTLGQFVAADRFALVAAFFLAVFLVRLAGGLISWILNGK